MQSLEGKTDGQIEVTLEVTNKLYIRLLDNGRGIPMELQEKYSFLSLPQNRRNWYRA